MYYFRSKQKSARLILFFSSGEAGERPMRARKIMQRISHRIQSGIWIGAGILLPLIAFAQQPSVEGIFGRLRDIIRILLGFIFVLAGLVFVWGVFKYITAAGDEKKVEEARKFIGYGIIGIVVMFVFWGLVNIIITFFGFSPGGGAPATPTLPFPGGIGGGSSGPSGE